MCGICGELRFDGAGADLAAIERMTETLVPRGPDHGGSWSDGALGFGHRRLSIIDLSERAHQPMVDPELGLALVFNGTIYNYRALRTQLAARGYRFFSDGDTEVILKAYREWGPACVERLHGMFAFGLWDLRAAHPVPGPGPLRHQAPLLDRRRPAAALRLHPPGPAGRGRGGHRHRPGRGSSSSSPCTPWSRPR